MSRGIIFVIHPHRDEAKDLAKTLAKPLLDSGFTILTTAEIPGAEILSDSELRARRGEAELTVVLGGDGTILRGAELVHGTSIPLLGVNLGHVGFLAQMGKPSAETLLKTIVDKSYITERRMTLSYKVERNDGTVTQGWALNEVTVERNTEAMIELFVQVDHRPLSRWGCDGVICATPTGSTAYAFSAGGPVVWPEVEALVLVPLAAHALFSDPMVISPNAEVAIDVESETGVLSADGLRKVSLHQGDRVILTSDRSVIHLAHIGAIAFPDRLVAKFKLPVDGWRGE